MTNNADPLTILSWDLVSLINFTVYKDISRFCEISWSSWLPWEFSWHGNNCESIDRISYINLIFFLFRIIDFSFITNHLILKKGNFKFYFSHVFINEWLLTATDWQVCATLGTTGACSFDTLPEIGPICK